MNEPTPNISQQDQFAREALNAPSKVVGELLGFKLRSSPMLAGSGLSFFGDPHDPNPKNYAVLIHDIPRS